MDDIAALESRISRAFDRIRAGLERSLAPTEEPGPATTATIAPGSDPADDDRAAALAEAEAECTALRAQLMEERSVTAQLEERVGRLQARQDEKIAKLEAVAAEGRARLASMDGELQKLRASNADLRDINSQLRDAMAEDVAEPHLVNKGLRAELDALRAVRESEAAEIAAVLAELRPLVAEDA